MSSDTSIALAKFPEGRRHTDVIQAVENMNRELYDSDEERIHEIRMYEWSKSFITREECYASALKVQEDYEDDDDFYMPLEYGIVDVGEFIFPLIDKEKLQQMVKDLESIGRDPTGYKMYYTGRPSSKVIGDDGLGIEISPESEHFEKYTYGEVEEAHTNLFLNLK